MTGAEPPGEPGRPAELQQVQVRPEQVVREPPGLVQGRVQGQLVQELGQLQQRPGLVQGQLVQELGLVQQRIQELGLARVRPERQVPEPETPRRSSRPL